MPDALLLDLDGVLVDSARVHAAAWESLFAEHGIAFGWERYRLEANGRSRGAVIRAVLGHRSDHQALMARKAALVQERLDLSGCPVVEGARALLVEARSRRIPLAIATASRMPHALVQAAGLKTLAPDVVVDRNMVDRGKPWPDVYKLAAKMLGVSPARCLVVEDSPAGLRAGRAAGCITVALTTTHPRADLQTQSDHVIDHLSQLWTVWDALP